MARAKIRIKHNDITHDLDGEGYVELRCQRVTVSGAKSNTKKPNILLQP